MSSRAVCTRQQQAQFARFTVRNGAGRRYTARCCCTLRGSNKVERVVFAVDWSPATPSVAVHEEHGTAHARVEATECSPQDHCDESVAAVTHKANSEVVRIVREVQAAEIPLAAVLRNGESTQTFISNDVSSRELSSHQQLKLAGLDTQDFTAVSSVTYVSSELQPEVLDATVRALGSDAAPGSTVVVSNVPLNLEAFHQAGFRVAQIQSRAGSTTEHTPFSTQHRGKDSSNAAPDAEYSSWEELQASSLLQLSHSASASGAATHSIPDIDSAQRSSAEERVYTSPVAEHRHPEAAYPSCSIPFSQGVSLPLLELHDVGEPSSPPPAGHALTAASAISSASPEGESGVAIDGSSQESHVHAHAQTAQLSTEPSVPVAKETVAAAFMSIDEELDDDLEGLEDVGMYAVPAAAQNAVCTAVQNASSLAADSEAQAPEGLAQERQLLSVQDQEELRPVVDETESEETSTSSDELQATEGKVATILDRNEEPDVAYSSQESMQQSKQMSSILDWDDEPDLEPSAAEENVTKVLQGSVRVCPRSSVMQLVPGATKMEEIKKQAQVQVLEEVLAVETTVENDDSVVATSVRQRTHASSQDSDWEDSQAATDARTPVPTTSQAVQSGSATQRSGGKSKGTTVSVANGGAGNDGAGQSSADGANANGSNYGLKASSPDAIATTEGSSGGSRHGGGVGDGDGAPGESGWLEGLVPLPGGYKTTRRDVLRLVPLGGALGSFGFLLSRAKGDEATRVWIRGISYVVQVGIFVYLYRSFSFLSKSLEFASPKAILTALLPRSQPAPDATDAAAVRRAAFKRFIASVERRGSSENVPEFPVGAQWYNTGGPLKLNRELSGRVLVLDFWTFCCVNCMHVLPELGALERNFAGQPVTVVGVHSAKFDNEKDARAVRSAVLRYDVEHPVINDTQRALWGALGISSWPTQVVVSPAGKVLFSVAGEGHAQDIEDCVGAALEYYAEAGALRNDPLPLVLEKDKQQAAVDTPLRFPSKLAVHEAGDRLFITDSSNHRVVASTLAGQHICSVGGIGAGLRDGRFDEAAFHSPQGVCYNSATDCLYVADTENHAIRCIDLEARTVTTLAGNGQQGSDYRGGGAGRAQSLSSPWDLALAPDHRTLLVAMAGTHQIWKLDVESGACVAFSGTGAEQNLNGDSGASSAWAQPSGISLSADGLSAYVADAESSSIRAMNVATGGSTLLAGGDAFFADNLFQFGDKDASGSAARLQHPLATACAPSGTARSVYVADSYNHKIKVLDPVSRAVRTVAGSGAVGFADGVGGSTQFSEPGGLVVLSDGSILVADTNNSVIRKLTRNSDGTSASSANAWDVATVQLTGVPDVSTRDLLDNPERVPKGAAVVQVGAVEGLSGEVGVTLNLPEGYHLTEGAGSGWEASVQMKGSSESGAVQVSAKKGSFDAKDPEPSMKITYRGSEGAEALISLTLNVYFCQDGDVCLLDTAVVQVPVKCTEFAGGRERRDASVMYNVRRASSTAPKLTV